MHMASPDHLAILDMLIPSTLSLEGLDDPPGSDFEDLLILIIQITQCTINFLQRFAALEILANRKSLSLEIMLNLVDSFVKEARVLTERYRELNGHYGWVLASDHELASMVINQVVKPHCEPMEWMTQVAERQNEITILLSGIVQDLEDII